MHIKQVIIEGFKSYKEQTALEPFHPKLNIVVGANGSGKSNFFHAVRFVLADVFNKSTQEERMQLLHEGAGQSSPLAYVEIIFDNSDGRFPVERGSDEVRLRRTVSGTRDELHVDGRHVTKAEVQNLLESAGFSRSNPYNVVQQGKVAAMATMKDSERLELLKELGGTRIYEDRRKESLRILEETRQRRGEIEELLGGIEDKLKELDAERADLHRYQEADRERRAAEYALYDKELGEARGGMGEAEKERGGAAARAQEAQKEMSSVLSELAEVEGEMKQLQAKRAELARDLDRLQASRLESLRLRARLECDLREGEDRAGEEGRERGEAEGRLRELGEEIKRTEASLAAARADLAAAEEAEKEGGRRLQEAQRKQAALLGRDSRAQTYRTKAERDAALLSDIARAEASLAKREAALESLRAGLRERGEEAERAAAAAAAAEAAVSERAAQVAACEGEVGGAREKRESLVNERQAAASSLETLDAELRVARSDRERRERAAEGAMPRDQRRAWEEVRRHAQDHQIKGVHGLLIDLVSVPDVLATAVEVTAHASLFHVIVDDDATASQLIKHLNDTNRGRITFCPLNRLQNESVTYPKEFGEDAVPLLTLLKYDKKYHAAMQQAFGKTLVCRTLELASRVSRQCGLSCVTMEGDVADRKGSLRGGWRGEGKGRVMAYRELRDLERRLSDLAAESDKRQAGLRELEGRATQAQAEEKKLLAKRSHLSDLLKQARLELRDARAAAAAAAANLADRKKKEAELSDAVSALRAEVASLRADLGADELGGLSGEERARVEALGGEIRRIEGEQVTLLAAVRSAASRVAALSDTLESDLMRRREEWEARLEEGAGGDVDLEALRRELSLASASVDGVARRVAQAEAELEASGGRIRELEGKEDALRRRRASLERAAGQGGKELDLALSRLAALTQRKEAAAKKIKELGTLPAEALEKYRGKGVKELEAALQKANAALKGMGGVNRRALAQYTAFAEQRDSLEARRSELDSGEAKVRELVETLDLRKEEAVERTFKQVAKGFREIFGELVPGGKGELVMIKRTPGDEEEEGGNGGGKENAGPGGAGAAPVPLLDKFSGVKVRVSFGHGEPRTLRQLSGGQRTLVALALIFAIQRTDPAPFYLFDEIDAALDPQHRGAVARVLQRAAGDARSPAQFIVTTFHPQLVSVADQVYGVSHQNKVSTVKLVTKEAAMDFVQREAAGGGVGGAAAAAAGVGGGRSRAVPSPDSDFPLPPAPPAGTAPGSRWAQGRPSMGKSSKDRVQVLSPDGFWLCVNCGERYGPGENCPKCDSKGPCLDYLSPTGCKVTTCNRIHVKFQSATLGGAGGVTTGPSEQVEDSAYPAAPAPSRQVLGVGGGKGSGGSQVGQGAQGTQGSTAAEPGEMSDKSVASGGFSGKYQSPSSQPQYVPLHPTSASAAGSGVGPGGVPGVTVITLSREGSGSSAPSEGSNAAGLRVGAGVADRRGRGGGGGGRGRGGGPGASDSGSYASRHGQSQGQGNGPTRQYSSGASPRNGGQGASLPPLGRGSGAGAGPEASPRPGASLQPPTEPQPSRDNLIPAPPRASPVLATGPGVGGAAGGALSYRAAVEVGRQAKGGSGSSPRASSGRDKDSGKAASRVVGQPQAQGTEGGSGSGLEPAAAGGGSPAPVPAPVAAALTPSTESKAQAQVSEPALPAEAQAVEVGTGESSYSPPSAPEWDGEGGLNLRSYEADASKIPFQDQAGEALREGSAFPQPLPSLQSAQSSSAPSPMAAPMVVPVAVGSLGDRPHPPTIELPGAEGMGSGPVPATVPSVQVPSFPYAPQEAWNAAAVKVIAGAQTPTGQQMQGFGSGVGLSLAAGPAAGFQPGQSPIAPAIPPPPPPSGSFNRPPVPLGPPAGIGPMGRPSHEGYSFQYQMAQGHQGLAFPAGPASPSTGMPLTLEGAQSQLTDLMKHWTMLTLTWGPQVHQAPLAPHFQHSMETLMRMIKSYMGEQAAIDWQASAMHVAHNEARRLVHAQMQHVHSTQAQSAQSPQLQGQSSKAQAPPYGADVGIGAQQPAPAAPPPSAPNAAPASMHPIMLHLQSGGGGASQAQGAGPATASSPLPLQFGSGGILTPGSSGSGQPLPSPGAAPTAATGVTGPQFYPAPSPPYPGAGVVPGMVGHVMPYGGPGFSAALPSPPSQGPGGGIGVGFSQPEAPKSSHGYEIGPGPGQAPLQPGIPFPRPPAGTAGSASDRKVGVASGGGSDGRVSASELSNLEGGGGNRRSRASSSGSIKAATPKSAAGNISSQEGGASVAQTQKHFRFEPNAPPWPGSGSVPQPQVQEAERRDAGGHGFPDFGGGGGGFGGGGFGQGSAQETQFQASSGSVPMAPYPMPPSHPAPPPPAPSAPSKQDQTQPGRITAQPVVLERDGSQGRAPTHGPQLEGRRGQAGGNPPPGSAAGAPNRRRDRETKRGSQGGAQGQTAPQGAGAASHGAREGPQGPHPSVEAFMGLALAAMAGAVAAAERRGRAAGRAEAVSGLAGQGQGQR